MNVGKEYSSPVRLTYSVPQGSMLGPLLFLYVNKWHTTCRQFQVIIIHKWRYRHGKRYQNNRETTKQDFSSLCQWCIDNRFSIHFGEEKTKSILCGTKGHQKEIRQILTLNTVISKSNSTARCIFDNNLSRESMTTEVLRLVNGILKFLYRKQRFLTYPLRRLLCSALIQPHYHYVCFAWYPSLSKRLLKKSNYPKINVSDIV